MDMDFVWNGVAASSLGVCVTELPPVQASAKRDEQYQVPYRDGILHVQDGTRDELIKRVGCYLPYEQGVTVEALREIFAWLQGKGVVSFSDDPGRQYEARIISAIDYRQWVTGFEDREFEVYFECDPRAFFTEAEDVEVTESGAVISNPGAAEARPKLVVQGAGSVDLMISGQPFQLDGLGGDNPGEVTVDCEMMEATWPDGTSANHIMSGDFPRLKPGQNMVSWVGSVTKVTITPRWCD